MFYKIQVIWRVPVFVFCCYCLNLTDFRVQNNAILFSLRTLEIRSLKQVCRAAFLFEDSQNCFPCLFQLLETAYVPETAYILWFVVPSYMFTVSSAAPSLLFDLCFCPYTFSLWLWLSCIPLTRILVITLDPPEYPGYSPHIKILNLFTCMKSLLLCKIIFTGSRD